MDIVFIITGIFIIITGTSIKHYGVYDMISGYNTMSSQEKVSFNIEKFVTMMRNVFLYMGLFIVIGALINIWLKTAFMSLIITFLSITIGITYLIIQGQRLKKSNDKAN
jgi:hypothetical protein